MWLACEPQPTCLVQATRRSPGKWQGICQSPRATPAGCQPPTEARVLPSRNAPKYTVALENIPTLR